jgi:protein-tyrosine-phosphatase
MDKIPKVLFLSRGSASRSQMARALLRSVAGPRVIPHGAGTESSDVHPLVAIVLSEIGIDTSAEQPLQLASLFSHTFQYVVTLSDERTERHAVYPFTRNLVKWSVPNPEALTTGDPEDRIEAFRQIRDQMLIGVKDLMKRIEQPQPAFPFAHRPAA